MKIIWCQKLATTTHTASLSCILDFRPDLALSSYFWDTKDPNKPFFDKLKFSVWAFWDPYLIYTNLARIMVIHDYTKFV